LTFERWSAAPAIARDAAVLPSAVETLQTLTDVDRDGISSLFGGQDCAPFDGDRSPSAKEIAGNGIDEDCDGADLIIPDQYDAVSRNNECENATDLVSGDFAGITRIVGSIHGGRDYDYYEVPPPFFTTLNKSAAFPFTFTVPAGGYRMVIYSAEADCRHRDTLFQHDVVGPAVEHLTLTDSGAMARSAYLVKVRSLDGTYNCDETYSIESGHIRPVVPMPTP